MPITRFVAVVVACLSLSALAPAQTFLRNTTDIPSGSPFNNSTSENVDFADVDLDGDWDAAFADGGDPGNDQNRLWINQGGAQAGTLGVFADQTALRFPSVQDTSRDVEFVDFDNDGDPDLYISNTAQLVNQSSRWWHNQNMASGFYADETSTRWVDLGVNGSSVPLSHILGGGGFIDWSCDSDFADLDNDGDMDLFHSSYGGSFTGQVPSRIFLNDGNGNFQEFNPSGFQLTVSAIANGNPALWASGTQQADTGDQTGTNADIATSALDIDLGDLDGDFDLDVLHGARDERPRVFQNRLEENGGTLAPFRDIGGSNGNPGALPAFVHGNNNYEQELGDFDGDGDLDLFGLNWLGFNDGVATNDGTGSFSSLTPLANSGSDDVEGDFLDFDNDGDLDLVIANFSGQDRLYRNNGVGAFTDVTGTDMPPNNTSTLDIDACDVDGDGDYDMFSANEPNQANWYYENTSGVSDTHAPNLPLLEQVGDSADSARVVRVHVYDNAPYYLTWYNQTYLEVRENGGSPTVIPMTSSGGQVFRGEIPSGLGGTISYQAFSMDPYGNLGSSIQRSYMVMGNGVVSIAPQSQTACTNTTVQYTATGLPAGGTYSWTITDQGSTAATIVAGQATATVTVQTGGFGSAMPNDVVIEVVYDPPADPPVVDTATLTVDDGPACIDNVVQAGEDVQEAIDAAAPGSLVLIESGTFNGFTIGKPVTVLGVGGPQITGLVEISNLMVGELVVLADLNLNALDVLSNAGCVAMNGLIFTEDVGGPATPRNALVSVVGSADVRAGECTVNLLGETSSRHAVEVDASRIEVAETVLLSAGGADSSDDEEGGPGGFGLALQNAARAHSSLSSMRGGGGGLSLGVGPAGGDGGPAVQLEGSSEIVLTGVLPGTRLIGGDGKRAMFGYDGAGGHAVALLHDETPKSVRHSGVDLDPGTGGFSARDGDPIGDAQPIDTVVAPTHADPSLELIGVPQDGVPFTLRVHAFPGTDVQLNSGLQPQVLDDGLAPVELLVVVTGTQPLGIVPPAGFIDVPLNFNIPTGGLLFFQADVLDGPNLLRTNSVPVLFR